MRLAANSFCSLQNLLCLRLPACSICNSLQLPADIRTIIGEVHVDFSFEVSPHTSRLHVPFWTENPSDWALRADGQSHVQGQGIVHSLSRESCMHFDNGLESCWVFYQQKLGRGCCSPRQEFAWLRIATVGHCEVIRCSPTLLLPEVYLTWSFRIHPLGDGTMEAIAVGFCILYISMLIWFWWLILHKIWFHASLVPDVHMKFNCDQAAFFVWISKNQRFSQIKAHCRRGWDTLNTFPFGPTLKHLWNHAHELGMVLSLRESTSQVSLVRCVTIYVYSSMGTT